MELHNNTEPIIIHVKLKGRICGSERVRHQQGETYTITIERSHSGRLTNFTGTGLMTNATTNFASNTRADHASRVSPGSSSGNIFQSRNTSVRKMVASVIENLRPIHVRGPGRWFVIFLNSIINGVARGCSPTLNPVKDSSLEDAYHLDGLNFFGSSKYRGLYSVQKVLVV